MFFLLLLLLLLLFNFFTFDEWSQRRAFVNEMRMVRAAVTSFDRFNQVMLIADCHVARLSSLTNNFTFINIGIFLKFKMLVVSKLIRMSGDNSGFLGFFGDFFGIFLRFYCQFLRIFGILGILGDSKGCFGIYKDVCHHQTTILQVKFINIRVFS